MELIQQARLDSMNKRFQLVVLLFGTVVIADISDRHAKLVAADGAESSSRVLTGHAALGDWTTDAPGVRRRITLDDLATPYETPSANNFPMVVRRPEGAWPKAPEGFTVTEFAMNLIEPRVIVRAPNGDLFLSESHANRLRVFRDADGDGQPEINEIFATGLERPFGIAFYPLGPDPKYVYVGNTGSVVRFPYQNGDTKARGEAEVIVPDIPTGRERVGGGWALDP
jgi:glucose/arabinose dehydrogenase